MNDYDEHIDLDIESRGDFLIVTPFVKEITFKNHKYLLKIVKDEIGNKVKKVVFNMKTVEIIDSVSLGTLVAILKYVRSLGGELIITGVSQQIHELFLLLNFQNIFRTFDNVEEAINNYKP